MYIYMYIYIHLYFNYDVFIEEKREWEGRYFRRGRSVSIVFRIYFRNGAPNVNVAAHE